MFGVAATTLASLVTADRVAQGALYPPIADLRRVSRAVAIAVATQARQDGVAQLAPDDDIIAGYRRLGCRLGSAQAHAGNPLSGRSRILGGRWH